MEKPTPTEAEQKLALPGIRAGYYLCFFGMHVFTPAVIDILGRQLAADPVGRASLSAALAELARQEQYLATEEPHRRYDIGGALRPAHGAIGAGAERTRSRRGAGAATGTPGDPGNGRGRGRSGPVNRLVAAITSAEPEIRDQSLDSSMRRRAARRAAGATAPRSTSSGARSDNLYERVRALFFLYAIHRFYIPAADRRGRGGR